MTDHLDTEIAHVRKRDGQLEPYSHPKLVACLRRALHDAQDADPPATAEGVADTLVRHLEQTDIAPPWPTAHLRELCESVLAQSGHSVAAQMLRTVARRRDVVRRQLHVANFRPRQARFVNRRWSKSTVVAALADEHGLERPAARWIAGLVETAILRSGKRLITTGLIRELIVSELLEWGLDPTAWSVKREGSRHVNPPGKQAQPSSKQDDNLA
ncbi:MAG: ATP cone domain-containing protein [Phycisphaerae bacterium]